MKFRYVKYRVKDSLTKKEIVLFRPVVPVFFVFGESRIGYQSKCVLSYEIAPRGFGILGQEGFFDRFRVIWHRVAKGIDKKKGAGLKAFLGTFRKEDLKSGHLKTPFQGRRRGRC